ncbi:hypothetical protein ACFQS2_07610 [Brachybacterium sp. GCM10030267]|uniref:hypothetical protein n=1 Tax=unclassified Brachybacterium TaxID=2623841 RepID=UPI003606FE4C
MGDSAARGASPFHRAAAEPLGGIDAGAAGLLHPVAELAGGIDPPPRRDGLMIGIDPR